MSAIKKITIHVQKDLLEKARKSTGKSITETVRDGLQLLAASSAYETLRSFRGKLKFSVPAKDLRRDRM